MDAVFRTPLLDERFLLLETLGIGGMGRVFRAFDRLEQRLVALKVLRDPGPPGPAHPLSGEFEAWSALEHPNIVRILDLGRSRVGPLRPDTPYLVMELFRGRPVHHVRRAGSFEPAWVEEIARRLLHALACVHAAGFVHRDVKPANVLMGTPRRGPGRVKLTDFGLAVKAGTSREPGRVSGSLPYLAPEVLLGERLDGRTDLYGLGILLHYLAAGAVPQETRDVESILRWHLEPHDADPRRLRPELPRPLSRFICRLTERDREARPASAEEALFLIGDRLPRRRAAPRALSDRSDRAGLRLAFDAVRLGARRWVELSPREQEAPDRFREIRVLARVRGLAVETLKRANGSGRSSLGRIVLHRLHARGGEVRGLVRRHQLGMGLPLRLFGGLPVWDGLRDVPLTPASDPVLLETTARGVASFLLEDCGREPLVLIVRKSAGADPMSRRVVEHLLNHLANNRRDFPATGGLLLLLEAPLASHRAERRQEHPLVLPQFTQA